MLHQLNALRRFPPGPKPVSRAPWSLARYYMTLRRDLLGLVRRRFETYGDIYYAPIGNTQLYVVRHPDAIREVLLTKAASFQKTEVGNAARQLDKLLGKGLLNSNGDFWRKQRRMINPAFHRKRISQYAAVMVEHTERMLSNWRSGQHLDASQAMNTLTMGIVTHTLFDHDVRHESDAVVRTLTAFRGLFSNPFLAIAPDWVPLPPIRKANEALRGMDALVYRMIDERLEALHHDAQTRTDLLSALVRAADEEDPTASMTRKQLRDEILTLFLAGHETTSIALAWTWYALSQHPDIEARLHQELDTVLEGRAPTFADLERLTYTQNVLQESMRLYPPAFGLSRYAREPVEIAGYPLPQGAEVIISIYWAHRDDRWWPNPERFEPERFAEDAPKPIPGSYLPFGAGQRICIGKRFAMMEATLLLATIARQYRLEMQPGAPKPTPQPAITLNIKGGLPMVLRKR